MGRAWLSWCRVHTLSEAGFEPRHRVGAPCGSITDSTMDSTRFDGASLWWLSLCKLGSEMTQDTLCEMYLLELPTQTQTQTHTQTHRDAHRYTHIQINTQSGTHRHAETYTQTHTQTYTQRHTYIHTHTNIHSYTHRPIHRETHTQAYTDT